MQCAKWVIDPGPTTISVSLKMLYTHTHISPLSPHTKNANFRRNAYSQWLFNQNIKNNIKKIFSNIIHVVSSTTTNHRATRDN